ncbi:MAG TPA: KGG domain-containing protein [Candidatus Limnocylindrales bacterium]|nr:KGG domain-containing protein [Candidatus Limnocylindrales bacterium]
MRSSTATGKRKKAKGPAKGQARRSQAAAGREKGTRRKRASAKAGPRGFASMSAARQRAIARMGGEAAHREGTAHEFSPREAREAGRKGGVAVSRDRQHMARIGRKGGEH